MKNRILDTLARRARTASVAVFGLALLGVSAVSQAHNVNLDAPTHHERVSAHRYDHRASEHHMHSRWHDHGRHDDRHDRSDRGHAPDHRPAYGYGDHHDRFDRG